MLVLSRELAERIVIILPDGREMYVSIERIQHNREVRVGIDAPEDVKVWREDLLERIEAERRNNGDPRR